MAMLGADGLIAEQLFRALEPRHGDRRIALLEFALGQGNREQRRPARLTGVETEGISPLPRADTGSGVTAPPCCVREFLEVFGVQARGLVGCRQELEGLPPGVTPNCFAPRFQRIVEINLSHLPA